MAKVDFRLLCEEYAKEQVEKQKEQFKRLGILGEWDNAIIYCSISPVGVHASSARTSRI